MGVNSSALTSIPRFSAHAGLAMLAYEGWMVTFGFIYDTNKFDRGSSLHSWEISPHTYDQGYYSTGNDYEF